MLGPYWSDSQGVSSDTPKNILWNMMEILCANQAVQLAIAADKYDSANPTETMRTMTTTLKTPRKLESRTTKIESPEEV
jgi:hypothetical protein